jgi:DNA-binding NtrC family response regulator
MPNAQETTVFVVDDEAVIVSTLVAILNQSQFKATAFVNPLKALEVAKEKAPDLLISDVVMPGMNGIDLAIQVKALRPDCKVLLFSGNAATSHLLDSAKDAGHNFTLLAKPIHPTELLAALKAL